MTKIELEMKVTNLLHQVGMLANLLGFHYTRAAIIKCLDDNSLLQAIVRELYPLIAKDYDTTGSRVERAIRHAIEVAWERGNVDLLDKIFGYTVNVNKGKPTNSEFIAMIVDNIRLEICKETEKGN